MVFVYTLRDENIPRHGKVRGERNTEKGCMSLFEKAKMSKEQLRSLMPGTEAQLPEIDTDKRYDGYCREDGVKTVVYRNARFRSRSALLPKGPRDIFSDFLELE
jgi:hypothetical protein